MSQSRRLEKDPISQVARINELRIKSSRDYQEFAKNHKGQSDSMIMKLWNEKQKIVKFSDLVVESPMDQILTAIRNSQLDRFIELVKVQLLDGKFPAENIEYEIARYGQIRFLDWCFENQAIYLAEREKDMQSFNNGNQAYQNYRQNTWDVLQTSAPISSEPISIAMREYRYKFIRSIANRQFPASLVFNHMQNKGVHKLHLSLLKMTIDKEMLLFIVGLTVLRDKSPVYGVFPDCSQPKLALQKIDLTPSRGYEFKNPTNCDHPLYISIKRMIHEALENLDKLTHAPEYISILQQIETFPIDKISQYIVQHSEYNYKIEGETD